MYPHRPYRRVHNLTPPNNYVPYMQPNYFLPYQPYRQFPSVNPSMFMTSAKRMQIIMKDASTILAEMSSSKKFSLDLMSAAQNSNKERVNQLLKDTGIQTMPKVSYNPDGLKLEFRSYVEDMNCCHLSLSLRWM